LQLLDGQHPHAGQWKVAAHAFSPPGWWCTGLRTLQYRHISIRSESSWFTTRSEKLRISSSGRDRDP